MTGLLQVVYKRYASLYFVMGVDSTDNELLTLEIIHHFVEVLDRYFGNVCELDLIFNFHKVRPSAVLLQQDAPDFERVVVKCCKVCSKVSTWRAPQCKPAAVLRSAGTFCIFGIVCKAGLISASLKCCSACCRCSKVQMTVKGCSQVLKACFEIWA